MMWVKGELVYKTFVKPFVTLMAFFVVVCFKVIIVVVCIANVLFVIVLKWWVQKKEKTSCVSKA